MRMAVFNDTVKKRNTRLKEKLEKFSTEKGLTQATGSGPIEEIPKYVETA